MGNLHGKLSLVRVHQPALDRPLRVEHRDAPGWVVVRVLFVSSSVEARLTRWRSAAENIVSRYTTFWQYADSGSNPGDQDEFNGSLQGLKKCASHFICFLRISADEDCILTSSLALG